MLDRFRNDLFERGLLVLDEELEVADVGLGGHVLEVDKIGGLWVEVQELDDELGLVRGEVLPLLVEAQAQAGLDEGG